MTHESWKSFPSRKAIAEAHKKRGGRVAAVLPIHYPRSLLRAFGILPIEVWGPPRIEADLGASHLQAYVCSIVRNALAFLLAGGLEAVDLIVVPHACDSLQGLGSILLDFVKPHQEVLTLYLPRGEGQRRYAFLIDELRAMYRRLSEVTQLAPSDDDLRASLRREEAADELLRQLHQQRSALSLASYDFYHLLRSREFLPAESFSGLAQSALGQAGAAQPSRVPLILSGIVPEPMNLLSFISGIGGEIVADDLACCARRLYPAGTSEDPFQRMAERMLGGPPDPTLGSPISARLEHLRNLITANAARGVIFYNIKFCEPEAFDLPLLRTGLQEAGVPSLVLEVDVSDPLSHQARTRIEAFLEMIA
jgi:benzoyl-CoA reductase/2-hydroxyglutaryl-CoA dehydratase subunit BcrC/BadD/HgdB